MLGELLKSAKESLIERLSSPLLGSFALSWCLWNYKFLVILFSSASVSTTFKLVDSIAFPDIYTLLIRGLLLPALTAAAYIFIYPYPARFIYGFTRRRQREINELRRQIENETPLTLEESRTIRAEIFQLERKNQETIDRLNGEITRLNSELQGARLTPSEKEAMQPNDSAKLEALSQTQLALLRSLEKAGGKAVESHLIRESAEPKVKTEFDIGELEKRKLVHRNYDQAEAEYTFEFTHEGRRAFLDHVERGA